MGKGEAYSSYMSQQHRALRRQHHALQVEVVNRRRFGSQDSRHELRELKTSNTMRRRVDLVGRTVVRRDVVVPAETAPVDVGESVRGAKSAVGGGVLDTREVMLVDCAEEGEQGAETRSERLR